MKRTTRTPALDAFRAGRAIEPIGYIRGRAIMPIAGGAQDEATRVAAVRIVGILEDARAAFWD